MLIVRELIGDVIKKNVTSDAWVWLLAKVDELNTSSNFGTLNTVFAAIPRKTGKQHIVLSQAEIKSIQVQRKNLLVAHWTVDRLARVWVLMHLKEANVKVYKEKIEAIFPSAEMNELVALYSALPILDYPEIWTERCSEGIRSNIETVLNAIICNNPYPSEQLNEAAWNQLVLKAFFTNQPGNEIIGLDARANPKLSATLIDFAHERWAAGRTVPLQLWRCVGPFINESNFGDIQKLIRSEDQKERNAALLACKMSSYPPAQSLLSQYQKVEKEIAGWDSLAQ